MHEIAANCMHTEWSVRVHFRKYHKRGKTGHRESLRGEGDKLCVRAV